MAAADVVSARAIVCTKEAPGEKAGANWALQDVKVRAPKDGELRVRIKYSGICHTGKYSKSTWRWLSGAYRSLGASQISSLAASPMASWAAASPRSWATRVNMPLHVLASHRVSLTHSSGAGYIEAIGPNCSPAHSVGDPVLLSFAYCQECRQCKSAHPGYCPQMGVLNFPGDPDTFQTEQGAAQGQFFGQSSFSNVTIAKEVSVLNVKDIVKDDKELAIFSPLGCGFQTGAGTVASLGDAGPDDYVVIMGLGGVGLSAIMVHSVRPSCIQCRHD